MTVECDLCGLPTPSDPIRAVEGTGIFCCRGCRDVFCVLGENSGISQLGDQDETRRASNGKEELVSARHERADLAEKFLAIDGMHCTTCESFIKLRGESHAGIYSVEASYATDTVRIQYDPEQINPADLPGVLTGYGYTARFREEPLDRQSSGDAETVHRLLVGYALAMFIMPWYVFFLYPSYVGIETGILTADMTTPLGLYFPMTVIALFSTGVVFFTGWPILRGAVVSVRTRYPNMDLLLSVAILSAFSYSTVALATGSIHLYYDVAVAIVLVVTTAGYYENRLKRDATGLLTTLTSMRVSEATRRCPDGTTETVDVCDLKSGDEVVVRPGERVPVDGTVLEGTAAIDEMVLTGESIPAPKRPGDHVVGGSVATDGALVIDVDESAESTLDRLATFVWAIQSDRPGVQRFADRLATVFVPVVLLLGGGVGLWRLLGGEPVSTALLAGLTVLVAACPCAMGLATPLAIAGGLRDAVRRGIVVTNRSLFEVAPAVDTVIFDKTGTLTTGEMTVRRVVGETDVLPLAAAVEEYSSHPVASAIVSHARITPDGGRPSADDAITNWNRSVPSASGVEQHPGAGISGYVDDHRIVVGTPTLVEREIGLLPSKLQGAVATARADGDLPIAVGCDDDAVAVIVVGDRVRSDWDAVLSSLDDKQIVILTGDDEAATTRFSDLPAVDRVFAGVPPEGKVAAINRLRTDGVVAMVGDGTNDAPALSAADVGIALAGTAHAADAADVTIVEGGLTDVPAVFELASGTRRRIRENIAWAFCYNGIAIPLAITGLLNPLLAALAMAMSSVLVVTNSRRRLVKQRE